MESINTSMENHKELYAYFLPENTRAKMTKRKVTVIG